MRLIDADALTKLHCEGCAEDVRAICKDDPVCASLMWVAEAPTIEAEPVRHGEWSMFRDECVLLAECSECGTVQSGIAAAQWDYCPMCGCRMDGGADDGA